MFGVYVQLGSRTENPSVWVPISHHYLLPVLLEVLHMDLVGHIFEAIVMAFPPNWIR